MFWCLAIDFVRPKEWSSANLEKSPFCRELATSKSCGKDYKSLNKLPGHVNQLLPLHTMCNYIAYLYI